MYEEQVARGAALLDRVDRDWEGEIDLDDLAMETRDQCLLGQLYGSYRQGWFELTRTLPSNRMFAASEFGFTVPDENLNDRATRERFRQLGEAWRSLIRRRREAQP